MKKVAGFLLTALLAPCVIAISCSFISVPDMTSFSAVKTAAQSAALYFHWPDVSISKTKNLYDFNGKLIAFSVDIKNDITNRTGYVIISNVGKDEPVYEYSMDSSSPYDKALPDDTCLYGGPDSYYAKSAAKNNYYDVTEKAKLSKVAVGSLKSEAKDHVYKSQNLEYANKIKARAGFRLAFAFDNRFMPLIKLAGSSKHKKSLHYNSTKVLHGIPDYGFYDGCSPTAAAMALKYIYPRKTPSDQYQLIDTLAGYMRTVSGGATHASNIPKGIVKAMAHYGVRNTISYNETAQKSTFAMFKKTIDFGLPLLVNVTKSSNYANHSMCGIGYDTLLGNFIIVHDTNGSGNVYINMASSVMGSTHMWTYINKPPMY